MQSFRWRTSLFSAGVLVGLWGAQGYARHGELPNRIPEAAPYNVTEAETYPPPYEEKWTTINHPTLCAGCHTQIFQEWKRFGPLTSTNHSTTADPYVSTVFQRDVPYQQGQFLIHQGYYHVMVERAEFCSACHDVTNPLTIKNALGKWVGGFPIERTYTEWLTSRYADRPGNPNSATPYPWTGAIDVYEEKKVS